jgi:peptidoglycan/xylan/chitin deacetylase (PgdA/CDA1 family)
MRLVRRVVPQRPRALILCYHRIVETSFDPWRIAMPPDAFAAQVEYLSRRGEIVPLRELRQRLIDRPRRTPLFAVTFDDGYADNIEQAGAILARFGARATIFVPTAYIESGRELWWDELERAIFSTAILPASLALTLNGGTHRFDLTNEATTERHRLYESVYWLLRPLTHDERGRALDSLLAWSGASRLTRPTHRLLSADEIQDADGGIFDFGAHTHTHALLADTAVDDQRAEATRSKQELESLLGRDVELFAYPYGRARDYTRATVEAVRAAGFELACTTVAGVCDRGTDPFQLPRLCVEEREEDAFQDALEALLT